MRTTKGFLGIVKSTVFLAAALFSGMASAITYDLNYEFSGATPPAGADPWVQISITDDGLGNVTLKIDNLGLIGTEFNSRTFVNVADAFRSTLTIVQGTSVGTFGVDSIDQQSGAQNSGAGTFKADGDGFFDVHFGFDTSSGNTFGAGESVEFNITSSVSGLTANSFDLASFSPGPGGNGVWHAAAHIQSIGEGKSGWIGDKPDDQTDLPDGGSTIALLGFALIGVDFLRRKISRA